MSGLYFTGFFCLLMDYTDYRITWKKQKSLEQD